MSTFNLIAEIKGVSSAKGAVNKALNYVKNAPKIPTYLGRDMTEKIASLALELGYDQKQFEKPLFKAIRVLNLPKDLVMEEIQVQVNIEVTRHCKALTEEQTQLISDVEEAGVVKVNAMKEAYAILEDDYKAMLQKQGLTTKQLHARLKKAGIVLPKFKDQEATVEAA